MPGYTTDVRAQFEVPVVTAFGWQLTHLILPHVVFLTFMPTTFKLYDNDNVFGQDVIISKGEYILTKNIIL